MKVELSYDTTLNQMTTYVTDKLVLQTKHISQ